MALEPEDIEAIARRVAELVDNRPAVRLVDAAGLADRLGVERDWVYAHARELGAIRLGGPHGRLRFDLVEVRRRVAAADPEPVDSKHRMSPSRARSSAPSEVELLPFEESYGRPDR